MRPSTLLRIERLDKLIAAFAACDMGYLDAAKLLRCSASAARNYLAELVDAGVIQQCRGNHDRSGGKSLYRLSADQATVCTYMTALGQACDRVNANLVSATSEGQCSRALPRPVVVVNCAALPVGTTRRDPLVAALFGAHMPTPSAALV